MSLGEKLSTKRSGRNVQPVYTFVGVIQKVVSKSKIRTGTSLDGT
jgi:hypothetical protein